MLLILHKLLWHNNTHVQLPLWTKFFSLLSSMSFSLLLKKIDLPLLLLLVCPLCIHGPIHLLPFHMHYELFNRTQRYNLGSKNTRLLMNGHSQALHFHNQFRIVIKHIIITIFVLNKSKVIMDFFHCKIF